MGEYIAEQSLNGHYCLATKEHYDKLVEDKVAPCEDNDFNWANYRQDKWYYAIDDGEIVPFCHDKRGLTTMHLHNNEWVFGSLEHEQSLDEQVNKSICGDDLMRAHENPKTLHRMTKEDAQVVFMMTALGGEYGAERWTKFNQLFDYIEYLESNQKDKQ